MRRAIRGLISAIATATVLMTALVSNVDAFETSHAQSPPGFFASAGTSAEHLFGGWEPSLRTVEPRGLAVAAPLPGGDVLIAGGWGDTPQNTPSRVPLGPARRTAEVFNHHTGQFSLLPYPMAESRADAVAAPLPGGRVLIAGGSLTGAIPSKTAEIFNPRTGRFHLLSQRMTQARKGAMAAPLADGRILIAGCYCYDGSDTAEVFDPRTGRFTLLHEHLVRPRWFATAVALPDGRVLLIGGVGLSSDTVEVFHPDTGKFTRVLARMTVPRERPVAVLINKEKVLIAGGLGESTGAQATSEVLNLRLMNFRASLNYMAVPRAGAVAAVLPGGKALIAGGHRGWAEDQSSAEIFDSATRAFTLITAPEAPPHYPAEHGYGPVDESHPGINWGNRHPGCEAGVMARRGAVASADICA